MKNYLKVTIFCFILLFFGCKKSINNSNSDQIASSENFAVTKFLTVPENLSPDIKEIVRDISKQQIKEPFLADFINKYGIPKWDKTITSHPALLNIDNSQTKSNTVDNQADFVSPIYLIPLIDTNSNNVKSYILCTRVQDSLFRYNVFNKQSILEKSATTPKDIFNGSMMLAGISALENSINKKSISEYPSPFGTQNDVKFKISKVDLNSKSNNKIQSNSIIVKKSQGDDCISQTYTPVMEFDFFFVIGYTQYGFHMHFLIGNCNGALITYITPWTNANYGTAPPPTNGPSYNFTDNSQMNDSYLFNSNATSGGTSFSNLNQAGNTPNLPPWTDPDASLYNQETIQGKSRPVLSLLNKIPNLTTEQIDWLSNSASLSFVNELNAVLSEEDEITDAVIRATLITIDFRKAGIHENYDDTTGAGIISKYIPEIDPRDPLMIKYMVWSSINAAIIRKEHPNWNSTKVLIHSQKAAYHISLAMFMFTYAIESILIDGALYLYEGNGSSASINLALAFIPGSSGVRVLAKEIISPFNKSIKLFLLEVKTATGTEIIFQKESILRDVIGLTLKSHQAHHLVPIKLSFHKVVQAAAKSLSRFHISQPSNGIPLLNELNQATAQHNIYTSYITTKLNLIENELLPFISTPEVYNAKAAEKLMELQLKIRNWFLTHENVPIGQISFQ
jgi:hypothetical protein